jgi:hypothetical protein
MSAAAAEGKGGGRIAMAEDEEGTRRLLGRLAQSDWVQTQEKSSKGKKGKGAMGKVTAGEIDPKKRC